MDTGQGLMVARVRDCDPTQTKQIWNVKTRIENVSEGQSICEAPGWDSSSHAISRCYMEDIDYRRWRWTTCHWLSYYTAGLYHVDHEYLNIITEMKCYANSFVFTGQPDSLITNHMEVKWNGRASEMLRLLRDGFAVPRACF